MSANQLLTWNRELYNFMLTQGFVAYLLCSSSLCLSSSPKELNVRPHAIVASKDHVMMGVKEGIAQANHGNVTPLRRMKKDDIIIYYSPKTIYGQNEKCQRFTATGKIRDIDIFQAFLSARCPKMLYVVTCFCYLII